MVAWGIVPLRTGDPTKIEFNLGGNLAKLPDSRKADFGIIDYSLNQFYSNL
jgi:hypothetical protein